MPALLLEGEVNRHDAVLLDDADQEYDANDGDDAEIHVNGHEQQQCTDAGRRQGRQDRDRMNEALIEHDDIHHDQGNADQERRALQRRTWLGRRHLCSSVHARATSGSQCCGDVHESGPVVLFHPKIRS